MYNKLKSMKTRVLISYVMATVVLVISLRQMMMYFYTQYEQNMVGKQLTSDIQFLEELIGDGNWDNEYGYIYKGETLIGNGTKETANLTPFLEMEERTGTFSYVFGKCSDDGLKWTGDDKTGYMQGHFLRIAGSTLNPQGESIVGTYMDKKVADILDKDKYYEGEANVDGGQIYCIYKTLENQNGDVIGAMVVGHNISALKEEISYNVNVTTLSISGILAFVFLGMFMMINKHLKHLEETTTYLANISDGYIPSHPLSIETNDEIGAMAKTINLLVDSLRERDILFKKSRTDGLTGIANRFYLDEYSEITYELCKKNGTYYGVEILDIDYFKQYNDNYGHSMGDDCIRSIAGELEKIADNNVFVSRFGGDEFVIIYSNCSVEKMENTATVLKNLIQALEIKHDYSKNDKIVTITQGIAYGIPSDKLTALDFLKIADTQLYEIKKTTRNDYKITNIDTTTE